MGIEPGMPYESAHPYIYGVNGVANMRDLGGYTAENGKKTVMGRFIRSTALAGLDCGCETWFRELGIECVIDLRSTLERKIAPDIVENSLSIHFEHVPMLDYISSNMASGDFTNFPASLTEMYIGLLDNGGEDFRRVFDLFGDSRFGGYLFHCTAGKDRTGVTAMLLLGLAGVDDEAIISDYAITERLLKPGPMGTAAAGFPKYLSESKPETMMATLRHVREKYGGVTGYLEKIGVGGDIRGRVLNKLLER